MPSPGCGSTLRHRLLAVPGRLINHARGLTLRLPTDHTTLPGVLAKLRAFRRHDDPRAGAPRRRARRSLACAPSGRPDQAMSNRSRFMTLFHAATKSRTNFSCASSQA
jgi:hypothetical protein